MIEEEITQIADDIYADYVANDAVDMNYLFDAPDKEMIIDVLNKLQMIIFPKYFRNKHYRFYTAKNNLTMLLEDVAYNLSRQIERVLKYNPKFEGLSPEQVRETAHDICMKFLKTIPKIREMINMDVDATYDGDPAAYNKDEIICSYPGLYAILVNRIAHELHLLSVPLIPRMMTEQAHSLTGIDIHPGATLGRYFCIDHGTGIVIGETTVIGDHVKIYQGVTLGALSTKGGQLLKNVRRHPTIEDNVTIYSGASILGGETVIGHDVVIGGNCFITTSIAPGTRVSVKNQALRYRRSGEHAEMAAQGEGAEAKVTEQGENEVFGQDCSWYENAD